MKFNRSMNANVMTAARSIELRATAKSDVTILEAYKAFQKICVVEKKYFGMEINSKEASSEASAALDAIANAMETVGMYGKKYFEQEFLNNSAEVLDRDCPDITGQINAMYNNINTLEQINVLYASAKAVKERLDVWIAKRTKKDDATSSVSNDVTSSVKYEKAYQNESTDKLEKDIAALKNHRGRRRKTEINE